MLRHSGTQHLVQWGVEASGFGEAAPRIDFVNGLLYEYFNPVADHLCNRALEQPGDDVNHDVSDPVRQQIPTQTDIDVADGLHLKVLHENVEVVHVHKEVAVYDNVVCRSLHKSIEDP